MAYPSKAAIYNQAAQLAVDVAWVFAYAADNAQLPRSVPDISSFQAKVTAWMSSAPAPAWLKTADNQQFLLSYVEEHGGFPPSGANFFAWLGEKGYMEGNILSGSRPNIGAWYPPKNAVMDPEPGTGGTMLPFPAKPDTKDPTAGIGEQIGALWSQYGTWILLAGGAYFLGPTALKLLQQRRR